MSSANLLNNRSARDQILHDEAQEGAVRSPGQILQIAREDCRLSVEEVAQKLFLTNSCVRLLEADKYEKLPEVTFIKGYIRSYANLLGIPSDPLVNRFNQLYLGGNDQGQNAVSPVNLKPQANWGDAKVRWSTYGLSVVLMGLVVIYWLQMEYKGFMGVGIGEVHVQSADGSVVVEDLNDPESSLPPIRLSSLRLAKKSAETDLPTQEQAQDYPPQLPEYEPVMLDGGIVMYFSGECWVSVKDQTDNVIHASLKRAGETLDISGNGPFKVLLGNAPVVELKFNGQAIDLKPFTRRQTQTAVLRLHS